MKQEACWLISLLNSPVLWAALVAGGATITGALLAGRFATKVVNKTKISEFRQEWINELREDIADYIGMANSWLRAYEKHNSFAKESNIQLTTEKKELRDREMEGLRNQMETLQTDASVILYRIRLRLNPRQNKFKIQDDEFLKHLAELLDIGKFGPEKNRERTWREMADKAVQKGRELLKREWEVTKGEPDEHA